MSKARPTAAERTVSMFTGKTDLESPEARDGTRAEIPSARKVKRLRWYGGIALWYTFDRKDDREYIVEKTKAGYLAWYYGNRIGVFDSILAAGDACEEYRDTIAGKKESVM